MPGAATSGFRVSSRRGPGLEKPARWPPRLPAIVGFTDTSGCVVFDASMSCWPVTENPGGTRVLRLVMYTGIVWVEEAAKLMAGLSAWLTMMTAAAPATWALWALSVSALHPRSMTSTVPVAAVGVGSMGQFGAVVNPDPW